MFFFAFRFFLFVIISHFYIALLGQFEHLNVVRSSFSFSWSGPFRRAFICRWKHDEVRGAEARVARVSASAHPRGRSRGQHNGGSDEFNDVTARIGMYSWVHIGILLQNCDY